MNFDDHLKKYINITVYLANQDQRNATKSITKYYNYRTIRRCLKSDFENFNYGEYQTGNTSSDRMEHCIESYENYTLRMSRNRMI